MPKALFSFPLDALRCKHNGVAAISFLAAASIFSVSQCAEASTISTIVPPGNALVSYSIVGSGGGLSNSQTNSPGTVGVSVQYITYPAQATAIAGGYPSGGVSVLAVNNSVAWSEASSNLNYYFTIQGPSNISVPVSVTGGLIWQAGWSGIGQNYYVMADASLIVGQLSAHIGHCYGSDGACTSKAQALNFNETSSFLANIPIEVQLAASAVAYGTGSMASATADPVIAIDPAFLVANPGYSVLLSEGVGNSVSAVPLPASMPLFVSGIIAMITVARRKKGLKR